MSRAVGTPVNQVRHTNVAIVRLKKKGKGFEIACYRNKVVSWRNKVETDLDEVLQIDNIFTNVNKGMLANSKDIGNCFDTDEKELVIKEILEKGELQVTDQERQAMQESIFRDIAVIVADKCMNPENNRAYTVSMIQSAMKQIHYGVNLTKSAKSQALDAIKKLKSVMPLARAPMSLRVVHPASQEQKLREELDSIGGIVPSTLVFDARDYVVAPPTAIDEVKKKEGESPVTILPLSPSASSEDAMQSCRFHADPDCYRRIQDSVKQLGDSRVYVEVIALNALATTSVAGVISAGTGAASDGVELKADGDSARKAAADVDEGQISSSGGVEGADGGHEYDHEHGEELIAAEGMVQSRGRGKDKKKQRRRLKQAAAAASATEGGLDSSGSDDGEDLALELPIDAEKITDMGPGAEKDKGKSAFPKQSKKAKRHEKSRASEQQKQREVLRARLEAERVRAEERSIQASSDGTGEGTNAAVGGAATATATSSENTKPCTTCGGNFDKVAFREHFRSEWHRFNLRRKMDGEDVLDEEAFLSLSLA